LRAAAGKVPVMISLGCAALALPLTNAGGLNNFSCRLSLPWPLAASNRRACCTRYSLCVTSNYAKRRDSLARTRNVSIHVPRALPMPHPAPRKSRPSSPSPNRKHTMHDVARLADVSISTVSALINGAPKVSEALTTRIQGAMKSLNYHPDQIARSLKVGRTHTIGVVIPDITNAFYPSVFQGIEDAARAAGYGVLLCNSNESIDQERAQLATLISRRVDGILLACSGDSSVYAEALYGRVPVVFVDRIPRGVSAPAICSDNIEAIRLATQHLIDLGHRRIGLLAGDLTLSPHADRLKGFQQTMQSAKLPLSQTYICAGGSRIEAGQRSTAKLLDLPEPPTAIIASNGKLLLGLLRAVRERGVSVPRDLSLLAFDESEWGEYLDPPVTCMVQPAYEMGQRAFEILQATLLNTGPRRTRDAVSLLPAKLQVRGSTTKIRRSK
jgi:LacI family transcriptional regulator